MIKSLNYILSLLIVLSVTLIPEIKLASNFPTFQLLDFLLPFILVSIYLNRENFEFKKLYLGILLFGAYIIFTILLNGRYTAFRDYFEVYKLLKFLVIVVFFATTSVYKIKQRVFYPVFWGLVVFNFLHYFNVLDFNILIEKYYNGGIHIKMFGLNSLGQPATKRMIGTIGNPNNNAILFLIFGVLFLPQKEKSFKTLFPFAVSMLMLFLCQSRTSLIALFGMIVVYFLLNKETLKARAILILTIGVSYLASFIVSSNAYLGTLFAADVVNTSSLRGRFESWMYLWEMIKHKPIFGYSPYKEYFYDNKLYSENEYILMTWRYGIIGLVAYVLFLGNLFFRGVKNKFSEIGIQLALATTVIAVIALANNPLSDRTILILFAIVVGLFFNKTQVNGERG